MTTIVAPRTSWESPLDWREGDVVGASLERGAGGLRVLAVGRRGAAVWPLDVARLASERAPRGLSAQERTPLELDEL